MKNDSKRSVVLRVVLRQAALVLGILALVLMIGYMAVRGGPVRMGPLGHRRTSYVETDFAFWGLDEQTVISNLWLSFFALLVLVIFFGYREYKLIASDQSCLLELGQDRILVGYNYLHRHHQDLLRKSKLLLIEVKKQNVECVEETRFITDYLLGTAHYGRTHRPDPFNSWIVLHLNKTQSDGLSKKYIFIKQDLLNPDQRIQLLNLYPKKVTS